MMCARLILQALASCLLVGMIQGQVHTIPDIISTMQKKCVTEADVLFIMDSSGSIRPDDYDRMLQFVAEITMNFDIGPHDVQFGGILFGTNALRAFDFNTYTDHASLEQGILQLPHISGQTFTNLGLDMARNESFTAVNGARPNVPKLAIVFTDGLSSDAEKMAQSAQALKNSGVYVMAIGVGGATDVGELNIIASSPSDVFQVAGFDVLDSINIQVSNKTCEFVEAYTYQKKCITEADILFIMDSSGSIRPDDYDRMLQFVVEITKNFNIGPQDVQFGGIIFGTSALRAFDFNTYINHESLEQGILNVPHISGQTFTDLALDMALTESFTPQAGSRPDVAKIAIVFTDGKSSDPAKTNDTAAALKASGVSVMSIGVGSATDVQELETIASSQNDVYQVTGYDVLDSIKTQVANKTCQIVTSLTYQTVCVTEVDIVFIMDSSGSIHPLDYEKMLQFIVQVTKAYNIGPLDVQFGGVVFGTYALRVFDLNTYTDHPSLEQGILATPHLSGQTYTNLGLDMARKESFTTANGARVGIPKLAIVFTDGQSSEPAKMAQSAQELKASGVTVTAIGVGNATVVQELYTIASSPNNVYQVAGYGVLDTLEHSLINKTCEIVVNVGK